MPDIIDPTEPFFKDGTWGWDGTQWRKLPLLWGYSDRWSEANDAAASGAGDISAPTVAVPAGSVYVLQACSAFHNAGVTKIIYISVVTSETIIELLWPTTTAHLARILWGGTLVLKEGDYVRATVFAPGDGKKAFIRVHGYKMSIAE